MHTVRCSKCGALSVHPLPTKETFNLVVAPGTRHHTLLSTNEPPDDPDTIFIQSFVSKVDARLACLDDEIAKLQDQLKSMEEERASLLTYRARNSGILSPLPEDATRGTRRHILVDVAPNQRPINPWVLTHVSARWRAISVANPSLWSRLVIDYSEVHTKSLNDHPPVDPSSAYPLFLVETQIQRSQRLKIHFYGSPAMASRPQILVFQLLSLHSSRWEEFSLGLTLEIAPLVTALRGRLLSLKRLWVQWDDSAADSIQSIDCFQTAPCLVDVGVYNRYRHVPVLLPVHQLTRYEMTCPWKSHVRMLKAAPNLVEAHIDVTFDLSETWSDLEEAIDLLQLQRLYVSALPILNVLRGPALEELAVWLDPDEDHLTILRGFVDRSVCCLRRICLRNSPDAHTTLEMLKRFPCITELVIKMRDHDAADEVNALISTLSLTESAVVAPQLQCLFFGCERKSFFDYTAYLKMLKTRWEVGYCALRYAALIIDEGPSPDFVTLVGLHALRREGLNLLLTEDVSEAYDVLNSWEYGAVWN
ncbi:hypothetical protein MVEN_01563200 [Mycena venus]|uniref:F-box domain-containing protein n=1 Tax=Mycena venus TaxID=2733690 RepID=A0A8H6XRW1_9AGAR|nr:hypothetical protein MVEN_01563200 [Mycena venus]